MARWLGTALPRKEDPALLRGDASFVADLHWPGTVAAAFLRSPHAHAEILSIDAGRARTLDGVLGVWSAWDVPDMKPVFPFAAKLVEPIRLRYTELTLPFLPKRKVLYAGQPVAVVVAEDRYRAEDALEAIEVRYRPLPPVVNAEAAAAGAYPPIHEHANSNVVMEFEVRVGNAEQALAEAEIVVRERLTVQRHTAVPLETRAVLAKPDESGLTVWSTTQMQHNLRSWLAEALKLPEEQIRVVAPGVGGGFGVKASCFNYPEEFLIPWLARTLSRPVKWTEDRREHMQATIHARDQVHEAKLGLKKDGTIVALLDDFIWDFGVHNMTTLTVPYNTACHLPGQYRVPNYYCHARCVTTNKVPAGAYRGTGRPEAVMVMERLLDKAARALDMDPLELRRINLVTPEEMPYLTGMPFRDGSPQRLDGGNFPKALRMAAEAIGYEEFRREQQRLREQGTFRGVGFAAFIESTGMGGFEEAKISLDAEGRFTVAVGTSSQGQSHLTTFAQICADVFGVHPHEVEVIEGDTRVIPRGQGTWGSRSAIQAGNAIRHASETLLADAFELASQLLETLPEDVAMVDGRFFPRGAPSRSVGWRELAAEWSARSPSNEGKAVREVHSVYVPRQDQPIAWANGTHAAMVEVDPQTGRVRLLQHVVVHDCGPIINPLIVDGQVFGALAQGIGGILLEDLVYDDNGQLLTQTLMDYLVPSVYEMPLRMDSLHIETPSLSNPLGFRGAGESGLIGAPAAILNAVHDALAAWNPDIDRLPLSPDRVWRAIRQAPPLRNH